MQFFHVIITTLVKLGNTLKVASGEETSGSQRLVQSAPLMIRVFDLKERPSNCSNYKKTERKGVNKLDYINLHLMLD